MSEEIKKVKEEDLKKIQENQKQMAQVINQVGAIEAQKQDLLAQVPVIRKEMDELKAELEKEYGLNTKINKFQYSTQSEMRGVK